MVSMFLLLALAASAPPTIEDAAAVVALQAACGDDVDCRVERSEEARRVAVAVLDACDDFVPRERCLTLVATLAESRMNASPTCSPAMCRERCGSAPDGRERRCRVACSARRGERAVARALSCNDGGTSWGWFQMKRSLTRRCPKVDGRHVDPMNLSEAARCYAWIVARTYVKNACRLKNEAQRWAVSFARVAGGPRRLETMVDGSTTWSSRCEPHRYARRAAGVESADLREYPRAVRLAAP